VVLSYTNKMYKKNSKTKMAKFLLKSAFHLANYSWEPRIFHSKSGLHYPKNSRE